MHSGWGRDRLSLKVGEGGGKKKSSDLGRVPAMYCFDLNYPAKRGCIGRDAMLDISMKEL